MALNLRNPNGYDGSPATTTRQGIVRLATAAEAAAGVLDNVALSPATAQSATALDFASPPTLGFGSTTPRPVHATTIDATTTITAGTTLTATLGNITATNGNLVLSTAGNKIIIATGSNASVGTSAAMTAGAVTVATTASSATALIFYSCKTTGGTPGNISITAQDGTGFTLTSTSGTETSTFNWWIINA
jgi:hypothetical protein